MDELQWNDVAHRLKKVLLQLTNEATIFERLMYKNTNQHRRSLYFRRLCQVRRELRLLQAARLSQLVENVGQRHKVMSDSRDAETATFEFKDFKRRTYGAVRLTQQIAEAALCAGIKVAALLGQTFFMPFALTTLAILARLWVLSQQALYDFAHMFNELSTWSKNILGKGDCHCLKLPHHLDCKLDDDGKISICAQPPEAVSEKGDCHCLKLHSHLHKKLGDAKISICAQPPQEMVIGLKGQECGASSSFIPEEEEMRKQDLNTDLEPNITETCKPNSTVQKVAYVSVCKVDGVETQKSDNEDNIAKKQKTDVFFDLLLGLQDITKDTIF